MDTTRSLSTRPCWHATEATRLDMSFHTCTPNVRHPTGSKEGAKNTYERPALGEVVAFGTPARLSSSLHGLFHQSQVDVAQVPDVHARPVRLSLADLDALTSFKSAAGQLGELDASLVAWTSALPVNGGRAHDGRLDDFRMFCACREHDLVHDAMRGEVGQRRHFRHSIPVVVDLGRGLAERPPLAIRECQDARAASVDPVRRSRGGRFGEGLRYGLGQLEMVRIGAVYRSPAASELRDEDDGDLGLT